MIWDRGKKMAHFLMTRFICPFLALIAVAWIIRRASGRLSLFSKQKRWTPVRLGILTLAALILIWALNFFGLMISVALWLGILCCERHLLNNPPLSFGKKLYYVAVNFVTVLAIMVAFCFILISVFIDFID